MSVSDNYVFFFWLLATYSWRWKSSGGERESVLERETWRLRTTKSNSCVIQQSPAAWLFFWLLPTTWPWRWKSSGGERKREKRIVEEKERETYTFFLGLEIGMECNK